MAIQNKVVIITGASSGIGEATAKMLASKGAKVVLGARREAKLKKLTEEIRQNCGEAVFLVMDVTKAGDNHKLVALAKAEYGQVDAIFLNAGLMPNAPLSKLQTGEWHRMVDVNLKGVLNGLEAVLPEFTKQKSGHVIATSSVAGIKVYPGAAVYCATKWAVRALMEALRMESAQEGTN
ncbi:MAG: SDR family oxidoreductase, partial [Zoogloeaceae bacterium]|nr:SDR family oxidoreductase [Zoogloeaceae bacterium]